MSHRLFTCLRVFAEVRKHVKDLVTLAVLVHIPNDMLRVVGLHLVAFEELATDDAPDLDGIVLRSVVEQLFSGVFVHVFLQDFE